MPDTSLKKSNYPRSSTSSGLYHNGRRDIQRGVKKYIKRERENEGGFEKLCLASPVFITMTTVT